jgi:hypothetical protein
MISGKGMAAAPASGAEINSSTRAMSSASPAHIRLARAVWRSARLRAAARNPRRSLFRSITNTSFSKWVYSSPKFTEERRSRIAWPHQKIRPSIPDRFYSIVLLRFCSARD